MQYNLLLDMKSKILILSVHSFKGFFSSCIYYLHFKRIFQVCFVDRIDRLERIYETLSLNEITFVLHGHS